jgi:hypothetical protein
MARKKKFSFENIICTNGTMKMRDRISERNMFDMSLRIFKSKYNRNTKIWKKSSIEK